MWKLRCYKSCRTSPTTQAACLQLCQLGIFKLQSFNIKNKFLTSVTEKSRNGSGFKEAWIRSMIWPRTWLVPSFFLCLLRGQLHPKTSLHHGCKMAVYNCKSLMILHPHPAGKFLPQYSWQNPETHSDWNNLGYMSPSPKAIIEASGRMHSFSWSLGYRQLLWNYMKPHRKSGALEKEEGLMGAREANQQMSTIPV